MIIPGSSAEAMLRDLPCGYLVLALDGTIRYANRSFASLLEQEHTVLEGRMFQEFLAPGGNIFYEVQFSQTLILRGALREIAFDLVSSAGKRVPVLVNATVLENENGRPDSIALAVFEIAQRRLYEDELLRARRESEQMSEVVRRSSDAIIRLTPEAVIESWNHGAQTTFGVGASEAIGADIFTFLYQGEQERELFLSRLKQGQNVAKEMKAARRDGSAIDVSVHLTPHVEPPGILVGFSAVIRDITVRKRAERALLQSEKLASVGRLASSIAHEINNPLEALTNLLYILRDKTFDPDDCSLLNSAEEELARVSHIARHTLRFYRQSSNRTSVHLCSIFESVVGLYRTRLEGSGITTEIECDDLLELHCYEGELRQILVHLVSNAFDAMRTGGHLRLRARRKTGAANQIRILVADNGPGISPDIKRRLFDPFNSTKGIGGAGLGLWIVRNLAINNRGSIRVSSSTGGDHHGTTAVLTFSTNAEWPDRQSADEP